MNLNILKQLKSPEVKKHLVFFFNPAFSKEGNSLENVYLDCLLDDGEIRSWCMCIFFFKFSFNCLFILCEFSRPAGIFNSTLWLEFILLRFNRGYAPKWWLWKRNLSTKLIKVVTYTFNPALKMQRQADLCEFEFNLICRVSSRTAKAVKTKKQCLEAGG